MSTDVAATPAIATGQPSERRQERARTILSRPRLQGRLWNDVFGERPHGGGFRAARRLFCVVVFTLLCIPVQGVLVQFSGSAKNHFARFYFRTLCWLIGMKLRVIGDASAEPRTLYVSNHTSWLDILVLGATVDARFVSKAEVAGWPLIGWVSKLGRTVFVSRSRGRTGTEAQELRARLEKGESLILFPEGTTSDGARVLPFRSSFFSVASVASRILPVTVVYDRLGGLPIGRRDRPLFAWYGDMETGSHAWRLLRRTGTRVSVVLSEGFAPETIPDRKAMAAQVGRSVTDMAAALRQNRVIAPRVV